MTGPSIAAALVDAGLPDRERDATAALFSRAIEALGGTPEHGWWVPGRLEVFGKHTDYAGGRSVVCAVPRGLAVVARRRADDTVHVVDALRGEAWTRPGGSSETFRGWRHYADTVVRRLALNFPESRSGADITFTSDLPPASGMSSSSALVIGIASALVRIRGLERLPQWRSNVPDPIATSAYFACVENGAAFGTLDGNAGVGTHGGSEDHAAILTSRPGHLSAFAFVPLRLVERVRLPDDWTFVIATSGRRAEKTGGARDRYNALSDSARTLLALWNAHHAPVPSLAAALGTTNGPVELQQLVDTACPPGWDPAVLRRRLRHFIGEDARVPAAIAAFGAADRAALSELADASQRDAEALLGNQVEETNALAASARRLGAFAAASFGAGFGGSVWALVPTDAAARFVPAWDPAAFIAPPAPALTHLA